MDNNFEERVRGKAPPRPVHDERPQEMSTYTLDELEGLRAAWELHAKLDDPACPCAQVKLRQLDREIEARRMGGVRSR